MSVSQFGLDKVLGDRLDRIEHHLESLRHLKSIAENLEWIASCHYQQFSPTTTASTKVIKGTGKALDLNLPF
jgi:hypothetical protein